MFVKRKYRIILYFYIISINDGFRVPVGNLMETISAARFGFFLPKANDSLNAIGPSEFAFPTPARYIS